MDGVSPLAGQVKSEPAAVDRYNERESDMDPDGRPAAFGGTDVSDAVGVPDALVDAILGGRCVGFVGAGFSSGAVPSWKQMLTALAVAHGLPHIAGFVDKATTALELEAAAQLIKDHVVGIEGDADIHLTRKWEESVQRATAPSHPIAGSTQRRISLLRDIPFRAVLTTNFDSLLDAHFAPSKGDDIAAYAGVLRDHQPWWSRSDWQQVGIRTPLIHLHGRANGQVDDPIVLARSDYRRRLYEDHRYANFVRSVFSRYTMLFLGVSFTDAYLNELRSEVLSFVHLRSSADPWGYAVTDRNDPSWSRFLRDHEGIEALAYTADQQHSRFDRWLEAICQRTSPRQRMSQLLGQRRIVWVDPNEIANGLGLEVLGGRRSEGGRVELLRHPGEVDEHEHASAALLITRFGHRGPDRSDAFDVLARVSTWAERPPVVVFAGENQHVAVNRERALRRGGYEYATTWEALFEAIERLFGGRHARNHPPQATPA